MVRGAQSLGLKTQSPSEIKAEDIILFQDHPSPVITHYPSPSAQSKTRKKQKDLGLKGTATGMATIGCSPSTSAQCMVNGSCCC